MNGFEFDRSRSLGEKFSPMPMKNIEMAIQGVEAPKATYDTYKNYQLMTANLRHEFRDLGDNDELSSDKLMENFCKGSLEGNPEWTTVQNNVLCLKATPPRQKPGWYGEFSNDVAKATIKYGDFFADKQLKMLRQTIHARANSYTMTG